MSVNDMEFASGYGEAPVTSVGIDDVPGEATIEPTPIRDPYPKAIVITDKKKQDALATWLDQWLSSLTNSHNAKLTEWAWQERNYRARPQRPKSEPYVGACNDVVPVMAMAVDPVHARLDTGIFKADPVFRIKPLKKSAMKYTDSLEKWIDYYQKHKLQLRQISSPRLLELAKHGTMVFKTVYEHEKYSIMTYDKSWKPIKKEVTRFKGPKVYGIGLGDFMFPPEYQHLQDCPVVAERQRFYYEDLMVAQASGKISNCEKLKDSRSVTRDVLEVERQESANHTETNLQRDLIEVFEIWCDYDINGDGLPERLAITYHQPTQTFLQIRYNWYFHQHKPYTVIPYSVANDSLYGIGIGEMTEFFQDAQTKWHQMATDNTYLANIRMFIAKKECGIEEVPKLYSGRTFFVDDPRNDFIPFQAAEIYNSTLSERQNLFGLAEKRTGISDYLTGRESPIIGSRATATSTVALIQEGTRRVEEVLENIRVGFSEIIQNCIYIWMQYGLDGLDDLVFADDEISNDLKAFFDSVNEDNVHGALAFDLSATDAANNKAIQQQVQLAIIQVMMQYLNKLVEGGQLALNAAQQQPELTMLIGDVMKSARNMFRDLLSKYDINNPDDYLPDLEKYLDAATQGQGGPPGLAGAASNIQGGAGLAAPSGQVFGAPSAMPAGDGEGGGATGALPPAGPSGSL